MKVSEHALIIFVKNPVLGKVKTRLAQSVGNEKALRIYLELLKHTRKLVLPLPVTRYLFYSDYIVSSDDWEQQDFEKFLQEGTGLGDRMANAFRSVLDLHRKAIIIGSDCASLTTDILSEAFLALDEHHFVVGPATDGGYYLLGMHSLPEGFFEDMQWSTDTVYPETIRRINAIGANYYLLPELSDIDHEEDWLKYGWEF